MLYLLCKLGRLSPTASRAAIISVLATMSEECTVRPQGNVKTRPKLHRCTFCHSNTRWGFAERSSSLLRCPLVFTAANSVPNFNTANGSSTPKCGSMKSGLADGHTHVKKLFPLSQCTVYLNALWGIFFCSFSLLLKI